jgi:hypothetical protein
LPALAPLLAALAASGTPAPLPATEPPALRVVRQLPTRSQRGAVVIRAERLEGVLGQRLQLSGDVLLRHGETLLRAPSLSYDESLDEVQSDGEVAFEHLGNQLAGHGLKLQLERFVGELLEPTYKLSLTGGRGRARRMDFIGEQRLRAEDASYSSCPRPAEGAPAPDSNRDLNGAPSREPAWELRTDELQLDLPANEGRAKGAVLRFQGVPILAAPTFSFPLTDERKSGWLPPHIGADNRSGIELAVPYYFNLAPNHDLTLTPFVMTRRGFGSDLELRGLQRWGEAALNLSLLPNDRVTGQKRWLWRLQGSSEPWAGARLQADAESGSDPELWKDLRRRIASPTPRLLARDLHAEQGFEAGGMRGSVYARALGWQVAQSSDTDALITAPYQRAPQLGLRLRRPDDARESWRLEPTLELEYNRFTLPRAALAEQDPGGERLHLLASVAMPLSGDAWWLTPRLGLNAAEYRTRLAMADGRQRARRSVPTASLDAGMVLERPTRIGRRELWQTLEPRILYVHTPYRAQESLPLYDSAPLRLQRRLDLQRSTSSPASTGWPMRSQLSASAPSAAGSTRLDGDEMPAPGPCSALPIQAAAHHGRERWRQPTPLRPAAGRQPPTCCSALVGRRRRAVRSRRASAACATVLRARYQPGALPHGQPGLPPDARPERATRPGLAVAALAPGGSARAAASLPAAPGTERRAGAIQLARQARHRFPGGIGIRRRLLGAAHGRGAALNRSGRGQHPLAAATGAGRPVTVWLECAESPEGQCARLSPPGQRQRPP